MNDQVQVLRVIRSILEFEFERSAADIGATTSLGALALDSLDLAELALALEGRFSVRFDDADLAAMQTVGDFVALVVERRRLL